MNFRERFEAHTNSELFRITDNPGDYQSEAVEAARSIIAERRLTDAEIAAARGELDAEKREHAEQERQGQQRRERRNAAVRRLVDALNPIRSDIPGPGRLVNIVCIVFGVWFLIWFVRVRPVGYLLFTLGEWDWSVLAIAVPLAWRPTAIILFWRRKKAGWFMFAIYSICSAVMALWSIVSMFGAQTEGVVYIGNHFSAISPITFLFILIFWVGMVWLVGRKSIRSLYSVGGRTATLTIALAALLALAGTYFGIYM